MCSVAFDGLRTTRDVVRRVKQSAGLLMYRRGDDGALRVLLVHPSGPYNRKAPWSIPKGEPDDGEQLEVTAVREVMEETGVVLDPMTPLRSLGHIDYTKSRKRVFAFGVELPAAAQPRCASWEIDKCELLSLADAREKIHPDQRPFIDRLVEVTK